MMKVLGAKRMMGILVLLLFNAVMAASVYAYLIPENGSLSKDLRNMRSTIAVKRSETEQLRGDYQKIQDQKTFFEGLDKVGFFNKQSRSLARERIEAVQKFSKVLSARYDITPAVVEQNTHAVKAGHVILNTSVNVDIDALDDIDFYSFVFWIENAFPGHTSVTNVKLERVIDVNAATLRQIGNGVATVLMKGKLGFSWRTMVPQEEVVSSVGR